ncbi:MAG: hypothetical protein ACRDA4_06475 [Filifactoraceae bacterium]
MKELSPKRWLKLFFIMLTGVLVVFVSTVYFFDPLFFYRVKDDRGYLDPRFVSAGLIKNADYDVAIIGSSMMQNFDSGYFRKNGWGNPIKLVPSGMTLNEGLLLFENVMRENRAKKVVINVDWSTFTIDKPLDKSSDKLPEYLYNDNPLDDFKYLLGYESWTRFMPLDLALYLDKDLRERSKNKTSIDKIGYFADDYIFSKEVMVQGYKSKKFPMTMVYEDGMIEKIKSNIDRYIDELMSMRKDDVEIIFALPPYSAIWWRLAMEDELYDTVLDARRYFVEKVSTYSNVRIVDMQSSEVIIDMNNYKDYTHFSLRVQELYADAIMDGSKDINLSSYLEGEKRLESLLNIFVRDNLDWLE